MAEPPLKLARVQRLRARLPYISQSALAAILAEANTDDGLPEQISRRGIGRARDIAVQHVTPYGKLHQTINVPLANGEGTMPVEVQNPFSMLHYVCNTCPWYASAIDNALASIRPLTLVLYTDEILPGNQLGYKSARKMWGFYWTILELGSDAVSDEATWYSDLDVQHACCSKQNR